MAAIGAAMIEDKQYRVTIIARLTTTIDFAPMERSGPITKWDAIENAVGSMSDEDWDNLKEGYGGEFVTAMEFEVEEL